MWRLAVIRRNILRREQTFLSFRGFPTCIGDSFSAVASCDDDRQQKQPLYVIVVPHNRTSPSVEATTKMTRHRIGGTTFSSERRTKACHTFRLFHASSWLRKTTTTSTDEHQGPASTNGQAVAHNQKNEDDLQNLPSYLVDLVQRSRDFVNENAHDDMQNIELWRSLLQDWVQSTTTTTQRQNSLHTFHHHNEIKGTFQDLYTCWVEQTSFPQEESPSSFQGDSDGVPPPSSLSFSEALAPLLPLWLQVFANLGMGPQALQALQGWTLCFGSYLELQPQLKDYETVLQAYATTAYVQRCSIDNISSHDGETEMPLAAGPDKKLLVEGAEVAMEILSLLHELSFTMKPVGSTYLLALQCLAAAPPDDGSFEKVLHQAEAVLFSKKGRCREKNTSPALWLDTLTAIFSSVNNELMDRSTLTPWLQAWSDWLSDAKSLAHINQNPEAFGQVRQGVQHVMTISLYLNSDSNARQTADDMLRLVEACEKFEKGMSSSLFVPSDTLMTTHLYGMALEAVVKAPMDEKTQQASQDLMGSLAFHHEKHSKGLSPLETRKSFLALLKAYYMIGAYYEVGRLFRRMSAELVQWDTDILELFLETAIAAGDRNLAALAWKALRKTVYAKRARLVALESRHFEMALEALLRCHHNQGPEIGLKILEGLEQVAAEESSRVEVTSTHYSKVATLMSRARVPGVAEEILKLMDLMTQRYKLEPNDEMFAALVAALGRSSSQVAAEKAEDLLQSLVERNNADVRAYVAVMYAWTNSGHRDWIQHVESIFAQLLENSNDDLKPHKVAYRAMLEAWGKAGREEDAQRAVELIEDFEKRAAYGALMDEAGDVKLYTAAMQVVWKSKVRDAHKIAGVVYDRLLEAAAQRPDDVELQPDSTAMTVLMQAWAGSIEQHKASFVWKKWQYLMEQFHQGHLRMKPSSHSAAAVLHACLFTAVNKGMSVRLEAVEIALNLWPDVQELNLVSDRLIVQILKVLGRHVDEYGERARLSTIVFQHACVNGCVSNAVLDALKTYVPTVFKELPTNATNNVALPPHWTRSVPS